MCAHTQIYIYAYMHALVCIPLKLIKTYANMFYLAFATMPKVLRSALKMS